jgi:short-subunit dehydrogenase
MSANVSVITGASSGIGAAYADRLAARGSNLMLIARREDRLNEIAAQIRKAYGVTVETLIADLQDASDLGALESRLERRPVAMLVNNAGAGGLGPTTVRGADAQEALIDLNVVALARLSLAALAGFRKEGRGALVNIASVVAYSPSAGGASYSGSKAFVLNFTRGLQLEYEKQNIQIQILLPGPVRTEFFSSQGMDDSVFPDPAYISAEALVDAALAGLDAGEKVTIPTLHDPTVWDEMEGCGSASSPM